MDKLKKAIIEDFQSEKHIEKIESIIFTIILEHIKDLVFLMKVDQDHVRYVFVNDEGVKHAGLTEDYAGLSLSDVMDKNAADHLLEMYSVVRETKQPFSYQDQVRLIDGTVIFGESVLTPFMNDMGEVIYIISVTRDISERVSEKQKLIESQQRYKSLFDHNIDSIFSLDLNGAIVSANSAAIDLMKTFTISLIGKSVFDLFNQDRERITSMFSHAVKGSAMEDESNLKVKNQELHLHLKTIPIILNNSIQGIYLIARDISDQKRHHSLIKHMAFHDSLTGLLNRTALEKDLSILLKDQTTKGLALMYIDLDRFKMLNDTMGHSIGDLLLKEVSFRLRSLEIPSYKVYRQGGDEFILLFQNADKLLAEQYAQQILDKFAEPIHLNELVYFISPSIGISLYPENGMEESQLITNADMALYDVKQRGRGRFQTYHSGMNKNSSRLLAIETGLRQALENNEFSLFYQPQVDLNTNETKSFEALLRWTHEGMGSVPPTAFISVAEESGLMIPIGEWIIEEVCKQLAEWSLNGNSRVKVAINLSSKQFQQYYLADMIRSLFQTYQIQPHQIEFEITEGALQNPHEAMETIRRLKSLGVSISIDDFGKGFSSLRYLKTFPIDTLKIDQSFIKNVITDEKDAAIITSIVHLAESLSLEVVAEGIETQEQYAYLKALNCQKGQGYFFSKPLPPDEIEQRYLK
ncbi:bifunctional diguanylate cyclase/phosphodiesterase [Metabacillus hrfriensis]|uniref:EAL domain-containing protein n=1 Tax=Metabacillus hrfriensis TaxID=3048891 RepID=A0ACD4RHA8_9BACI|nr:bifunctional diguanylate cyclase/phosphodiesterase [Metabacillus sp. CT-WN-B3]UOK59374.1 EAL domain-containing protein [Bacillus sp. OVS6]WHZ59560.1 EAL domain-containing protein [Metabacillus sp. CT-WN-B3]